MIVDGKNLAAAATGLGLVASIFAAGMAWQKVVEQQAIIATQQDQIRILSHVLVQEFPQYTLTIYP